MHAYKVTDVHFPSRRDNPLVDVVIADSGELPVDEIEHIEL